MDQHCVSIPNDGNTGLLKAFEAICNPKVNLMEPSLFFFSTVFSYFGAPTPKASRFLSWSLRGWSLLENRIPAYMWVKFSTHVEDVTKFFFPVFRHNHCRLGACNVRESFRVKVNLEESKEYTVFDLECYPFSTGPIPLRISAVWNLRSIVRSRHLTGETYVGSWGEGQISCGFMDFKVIVSKESVYLPFDTLVVFTLPVACILALDRLAVVWWDRRVRFLLQGLPSLGLRQLGDGSCFLCLILEEQLCHVLLPHRS